MGTLCKICPFRTSSNCHSLFTREFHNSCTTYDISKHQFLKELNEFEKQMKTEIREITEEKQKEFDDVVQHINEEMPKTDTSFQELPSDVNDVLPPKEEKPKTVKKVTAKKATNKKTTTKKATNKKVEKETTEEIKSETNDENTITD